MLELTFKQSFSVQGRAIGPGHPVFIIAEAGVAHFGSVEKAKALIDLAAVSGADAVKFQIFRANALVSSESEEWRKRLKSRELPYETFPELQTYCNEKGIIFFATAHDEPSLEFLNSLNVPVYKIGSGELGNWPFIKKAASINKPLILSTGMYTLEEIGDTLNVIAATGNTDVAVLHCTTSYPTPPQEVNLLALDTIRETYNVMAGYSDHTAGYHFPLAAAALGACIIEKHIALDFDVPDAQDWKVSCGYEDLSLMVRQIREIEAGMGTGIKIPSDREKESLKWARKSLVAAVDISEGDVLTYDKICSKRPGLGIIPSELYKIIGRKARHTIKKDTFIRWESLK